MNFCLKEKVTDKKDVNIEESKIIRVYLFLLGFLFFYNLKDIAFSAADEMIHYLRAHMDTFLYIQREARNHGRFYMYFSLLWSTVPYLFNSFIWYKLCSLGAVIINIMFFAKLLKKWVGTAEAFLGILCVFAFYELNLEHNLIVAYPFFLQLPLFFFLLSLEFYLRSMHEWKLKDSIWSALFFFLACMFNEAFVLTVVAYVFLAIAYNGFPNRKNIVMLFKILICVSVTSAVYLALYVIFKFFNPSQYTGNVVEVNSVKDSLLTLVTLVSGQFPLVSTIHLNYIWTNYINASSLMTGFLTGLCIYELIACLYKSEKMPNFKKICSFCIPSMVVLGVPYALTDKYVQWVKNGTYAYAISYYTFFGCVVIIVLAVKIVLFYVQKRYKAYGIVLGVLFGVIAFITSCTNQYFSDYLSAQANGTKIILDFLESDRIQQVEDDSMIYYTDHYALANSENYLSSYLQEKYNISTEWTSVYEELDFSKKVYHMGLNKEDGFIWFAEMNPDYQGTEVEFFSDKSFLGKSVVVESVSGFNEIRLNDFPSQIYNYNATIPIAINECSFTLNSSEAINIHEIEIVRDELASNAILGIEWNENSYSNEQNDISSWRWINNQGGFTIDNKSERTCKVELKFQAFVEDTLDEENATIWIKINEQRYEYTSENNIVYFDEILTIEPGKTIVQLTTNAKQVDAPNDWRTLYMKVVDFTYNFLSM